MVIDIKGFGGVKSADKTKAKPKASATGGPSFANMLEDAQAAPEASAAAPVTGLGLPAGYVPVEEDLPQNPQKQAQELMKTLQTLAGDAFAGNPTKTLERLEQLTQQVDEAGLTQHQKNALDEARTRAAVEVAKLKA